MSPQHLQQQTVYHEQLLNARVAAANPFCWGVQTMEVDPNALDAGMFAFQRFAGVLPVRRRRISDDLHPGERSRRLDQHVEAVRRVAIGSHGVRRLFRLLRQAVLGKLRKVRVRQQPPISRAPAARHSAAADAQSTADSGPSQRLRSASHGSPELG